MSSHILHEIEAMTGSILLLHNGQVLAEGDVHSIRSLIDRHPHSIHLRCSEPRKLAESLVGFADVVTIRYHPDVGSITVESSRPDEFYERLPEVLIRLGVDLEELTSPDRQPPGGLPLPGEVVAGDDNGSFREIAPPRDDGRLSHARHAVLE